MCIDIVMNIVCVNIRTMRMVLDVGVAIRMIKITNCFVVLGNFNGYLVH